MLTKASATKALNQFMSGLYHADLWIPRLQVVPIVEAGEHFLKAYICCTNQLYICGVLFAITFATTLLQRVVALTKIWWGEWRLFLAMFHPDLWRCGPSNAI